MEKNKRDTIKWINIAKFIAIMAVIIDHVNGILYDNPIFAWLSYFAVTVFIFLSGVTSFYSNQRHYKDNFFKDLIRRIKGIAIPYIIATAIYQFATYRFWDLKTFIYHLLHFNISGHFYYILVYLQLIIISPLLYRMIMICMNKKRKLLYVVALGCIILGICVLSVNYTYIINIYGGGKYLFGGSYLIIFYFGMLFASYGRISITFRKKIGLAIFSLLYTICCFMFLYHDQLKIERFFWFGDGLNPPGVSLILYSMGVVIFLFSFFSAICEIQNKYIESIINALSWLGEFSLYIYLYHMLILRILECVNNNILLIPYILKIPVYLVLMIGMPILGKLFGKKIFSYMKYKLMVIEIL